MKVKIVLSLFVTMLLLASCGAKNEQESAVKTDGSTIEQEEEDVMISSNIGGWQWTPPEEEVTEF